MFKPCEFLRSRRDVDECTRFLTERGFLTNRIECKNWDLAHILPHLRDGNILDMGCSEGLILPNAIKMGLKGEKVGVDLIPLPPMEGASIHHGDLTRTGLPADHFDCITCLSVVEHGVNLRDFAAEVSRLMRMGGTLFVTFDYWEPPLPPGIQMFGKPWNIFSKEGVRRMTDWLRRFGLDLVEPIDWTTDDAVIRPGYYSPSQACYTFGIAQFRKVRQPDESTIVRDVVIVRSDSIGDAVLSAGMLAHIAERGYPGANITMVCQESVRPLYEKCPFVSRTITFDRNRGFAEPAYREELAKEISAVRADICLNTVYSRDPLNDYLAGAVSAPMRIGYVGDVANIQPDVKAVNDRQYGQLVDSPAPWKPEIERHRDFLRGIGVEASAESLGPRLWTDAADAARAQALFDEHGLSADKTIALFAGGQFPVRDYAQFGVALAGVCRERGWKVVALGAPREAEINRRNLEALGDVAVDLTGKTSIREAAEVVRLCRLAVGAETSLAHVACAVGTPNVIILGGGHFGRFMPYSPLTTCACPAITCYGCNWNCRFQRPHCVTDVSPQVVEAAIRVALDDNPGGKPRIVAQDRSLWQPAAGQPMWGWFHNFLERGSIDLITVGSRSDGSLVTTLLRPPRRHSWGGQPSQLSAQRLAAATACLQASPEQLPGAFAQQARALASEHSLGDMPAAADERIVVDEILSGLARGEDDPWALQYRAAAMLYFRMHELAAWDPTRIPPWLFDDFVAWSVRQPGLFFEIGEADEFHRRLMEWFEVARQQLRATPQNARDAVWRRLAEPMSLLPNLIPAYFTAADLRPLMEARSDIMEMYLRSVDVKLDMNPPPPAGGANKDGRIRIGLLKNHWLAGTETYATLPLFEHLPRDRFEVVLYALEEVRDAAEAYCRQRADRFVILPQPLNDQAALLRREKCDVLFYAINMTAVTHALLPLAMHRMAPVQATSICSPCTSGLLNMDVFLAGELTEPRDDAQASYREKLIKLSGSGICFDYARRPPPSQYALTRAALNLDDKTIVFTSGANFFKVIPELRRAWAKLLAAAPAESVLLLYPFGPAWTSTYPAGTFITCFQEEIAAAGVDSRRLILLQPMDSPSDVPKVMAITDIYLDSFPYTGATSLLDPLEAGVPPITMAGDRLRFAQGEALVRELGMPELIASSQDDYIRIACDLARDRDLRERTRRTVREKMAAGPAFLDSKRFGANAAEVFEMLVKEAAASR